MTTERTQLRREVARALLAEWRSCWDTEEHALRAAARDHILSPALVHEHLDVLAGERRRVGALLDAGLRRP